MKCQPHLLVLSDAKIIKAALNQQKGGIDKLKELEKQSVLAGEDGNGHRDDIVVSYQGSTGQTTCKLKMVGASDGCPLTASLRSWQVFSASAT